MGENVLYSNQRSIRSMYSLFLYWSPGRKNPPVSVVQYGMPLIIMPRPEMICVRKSLQLLPTSPDQITLGWRLCPAKAQRVRMRARRSGCA